MRSFALPCFRVDDLAALVRLYVLGFALGAHVVTAATPNVNPLGSIIGTAIIVNELPLGHFPSSQNATKPTLQATGHDLITPCRRSHPKRPESRRTSLFPSLPGKILTFASNTGWPGSQAATMVPGHSAKLKRATLFHFCMEPELITYIESQSAKRCAMLSCYRHGSF
jgi:hypothetical protein